MFDRYIMSTKYLSNNSLPNEAINIRVNDLIVDGSYSGPAGNIPDPLVISNLSVNSTANINDLNYTTNITTYGTVTQVGTSDVTLNSQTGLITTSSAVIQPGHAYIVGLQNNLIVAGTLCKVWLHSYSGVISATTGLIAVTGVTAPGVCAIQIINVAANGSGNLNGTYEVAFELIQLAP